MARSETAGRFFSEKQTTLKGNLVAVPGIEPGFSG
jgi:hypothetical protein